MRAHLTTNPDQLVHVLNSRVSRGTMIETAITHIADKLNQHLMRAFNRTEDVVVLSNLTEQDATASLDIVNKLVVSVVNIGEDTTMRAAHGPGFGAEQDTANARTRLILHLLIAANFSDSRYGDGLEFISSTITYLRQRPVLDHQSSPDLDPSIERLVLEMENLSLEDLSHLWGVLNGKYLPSVLYKLRLEATEKVE